MAAQSQCLLAFSKIDAVATPSRRFATVAIIATVRRDNRDPGRETSRLSRLSRDAVVMRTPSRCVATGRAVKIIKKKIKNNFFFELFIFLKIIYSVAINLIPINGIKLSIGC